MSAASASSAFAGGATGPLTVTATVIARCQLSTVKWILNQDISTTSGSPLNILCPKKITPRVRVNNNSFDRTTSGIQIQFDHHNQTPETSSTTNQAIYGGNLIITVNF
jgi:hypothetical protein